MNHPAQRSPDKPTWQNQSSFWLPGLIILGLVFLALSLFVPFSLSHTGLRVVGVPLRSVLTSNYDMDPFSFRIPGMALDIIANTIGDLLTPRDVTRRLETLENELQTPVPTITPYDLPTSTQSVFFFTVTPSATATSEPTTTPTRRPTLVVITTTATATATGATPTRTATQFGPTRTSTPFIWYTPTHTNQPTRPNQPTSTQTPRPPTNTPIPPIVITPGYPLPPTSTSAAYP